VKKIPFMLIVGDKESAGSTLSVRAHGSGDLGSFSLNEFLEMFKKKIEI
jgi:threonyl-tRNA synthetase